MITYQTNQYSVPPDLSTCNMNTRFSVVNVFSGATFPQTAPGSPPSFNILNNGIDYFTNILIRITNLPLVFPHATFLHALGNSQPL